MLGFSDLNREAEKSNKETLRVTSGINYISKIHFFLKLAVG